MLLWILGALLCIGCDLLFAFLLHILMRSNVLTVGYPPKLQKKKQRRLPNQPFFRRLCLTDLVSGATKQVHRVYYFAILNGLGLMTDIAGIVLVLAGLWLRSWRIMVLMGGGIPLGVLVLFAILCLFPVECKRTRKEDIPSLVIFFFGIIVCPLIGWILLRLKG